MQRIKMQKSKLKVGIIGCGTIGLEIAKACTGRLKDKFDLAAICDIDKDKSEVLKRQVAPKVKISTLDELVKEVDLVIETSSAKISGDILKKTMDKGKDILIMSVGGLLGKESLLKEAERKGTKVYIPSGAICGIDGLKSASMGRIDSVTLTTRKPAKGLEGAPYLKMKKIKLADIKEETVLFEGDAKTAIEGFPQNVNVAAILSLAGIGAVKTKVRIVTSPDYTKNVHEMEISGSFGNIRTRIENVPSRTNPKTSSLAVLSAIATLEAIAANVRIGT